MRGPLLAVVSMIFCLAIGIADSGAQAQKKSKAPCQNKQARCAIQAGGTCDPKTNRWRTTEQQQMAYNACISRR